MSRAFAEPVDPATATAQNLWTLMVATGCTATPIGQWLQIIATDEALFWGTDNTVDASGNAIPSGESQFFPANEGVVDPSLYWVYSAGGSAFQVSYLAR